MISFNKFRPLVLFLAILMPQCYAQVENKELLWHMLLRGSDAFFLWCMENENPEEVRLLHEVYAESQQYGEFLDHGIPVTFDLPSTPGTVISGLALGDSVRVRRTDFDKNHDTVQILAGTSLINVGYTPGRCKVISMKQSNTISR